MRKGIKILGKVFSAAVLLLIILPVFLSLLLDIPAVQNFVVHKAAEAVSRKLETTVSIDRVDIGIFSKIKVKGFYVEDYGRDTLLYVGKLDAFITSFGIFGGGLELSRGEIADARLYLRQTPGGEMNIKQIVDRISDPDKPKKGNFRLSLKKASIENMDLCLERLDHRDPEHGIDFSHMHLYGITARVDDFTIDGQAIYTSIVAFSARERSGFVLNHLAGRFYMTQGCLGFENASIITPRSNVNFPFVSLAGDSWAQYKDFIGEVRIDASMRNTTVSTDDIAFFAPKLRDWHVDFTDVNVEVAGVVSDFTGRIRSMQIGEGTTLYPGVKIYEGCSVGSRCILHAGAVIGADGFGFMPNAAGGFDKIPQLGNVVIEDDVEIGANTCIDRAKTDSTIIRRGVKLDNLIQIGHNVQIGENTVSSAQTGIAGTSKVGHNCFLAGQVGIADHVTIGDRVCIGSKSGLDKDVPDGEVRFGYPALPGMQYHRASAIFKNLPDLARRVSQAEKEIAALKEK